MFDKFQPWVLATYGDSAKTKTITLRKAARIRALLQPGGEKGAGAEPAGSEAAKATNCNIDGEPERDIRTNQKKRADLPLFDFLKFSQCVLGTPSMLSSDF